MSEASILIVDGDEAFVQVTAELLKSHHYTVDVAYKGADALEKVHKHPDLILLERTLPDMDGLKICQTICEDKKLQHIPVVIFTACKASSEKVEGFSSGADDYIPKPVDDDELMARIKAILKRSQAFSKTQKKEGALAAELKEILSQEKITPYFQPIYLMASLMPMGVEAYLDSFVPSGQILPRQLRCLGLRTCPTDRFFLQTIVRRRRW